MPSMFWIDIVAFCYSTIIAFSLTLIVFGYSPKRRLNQYFAMYNLFMAIYSIFALLLRLSLWLKIGDPQILAEWSTFFMVLMGPASALFSIYYLQTNTKWKKIIIIAGFLYILICSIYLFQHKVLYQPVLKNNGSTILRINTIGYITGIVPPLYMFWTLVMFWQHRQKIREITLPLCVFILFLGYLFGGMLEFPLPVISITNFVSTTLMAFVVVRRQLFNPLKEMTNELSLNLEKLKQTQDQLIQAHKMQSVGRLAGGIAHDFNNILTVILGYSNLLINQFTSETPVYNDLLEIKNASERAMTLTQQLLAFSRRQVLKPKIVNLNTFIKDIVKLIKRLIGENIELNLKLFPSLGFVKVDPSQIQQVIMNLCINARDAMPDGGRLEIRTENIVIDHDKDNVKLRNLKKGLYILMTVIDTGKGMDQTTLDNLFVPFYTTKEKGKGTGLGLATVHGIIKQSDGHIFVESTLNKGTSFYIYLPRIYEKQKSSHNLSDMIQETRGTETILLVEDEDSVRNLMKKVLLNSGYKIYEASNGKEAVYIYNKYNSEIQLIITDVVMPEGLDGYGFIKRIKAMMKKVKILFISGYTNHTSTIRQFKKYKTDFLQKPFSPYILVTKVRNLLDMK